MDDDGAVSASGSSSSSSRRSRSRATTSSANLPVASVSAVDDSKFRGHSAGSPSRTDDASPLQVFLENYYYGTITPDPSQSLKCNNKELNMKVSER